MDILGRVTLLNNDAIDSTTGLAIAPTANDLKDGQIAVNYSTNDPCLFIKDNAGNIIKFTTEKKIAQTLSDILGESAADLSTLKELLSAFNGSENDVLTLIKNIQTELGTKASAATLNNHIASTSNPHGVTAEQTGAYHSGNCNNADTQWDASVVALTSIYARGYNFNFNTPYEGKPLMKNSWVPGYDDCLQIGATGTGPQKLLSMGSNGTFNWDGRTVWHAGNANNATTDWTARNFIGNLTGNAGNSLKLDSYNVGYFLKPCLTGGNYAAWQIPDDTVTLSADKSWYKLSKTYTNRPLMLCYAPMNYKGQRIYYRFTTRNVVGNSNAFSIRTGSEGSWAVLHKVTITANADATVYEGHYDLPATSASRTVLFEFESFTNGESMEINTMCWCGFVEPSVRQHGELGNYNNQLRLTHYNKFNSNIPTVDWTCKELYSYGQIRTVTTTGENTSIKSYNGYQSFFDNGRFNYGVDNNIGLGFVSGGAERFTILPNGNIGIGTSDINSRLTIGYTAYSNPLVLGSLKGQFAIERYRGYDDGKSDRYGAYFYLNEDTGKFSIQTGYGKLKDAEATDSGHSLLLNPSGGNVGIGTPTPMTDYKLEVNGNVGVSNLYLKNGSINDISQIWGTVNDTNHVLYLGKANVNEVNWVEVGGVWKFKHNAAGAETGVMFNKGSIESRGYVSAGGSISSGGSITATGEVIAYKAATALQEGTPVGSVVVYDGLDSTSPDVALSANMGRALNADVLATRTLANNAAKTATWSSITGTPDAFTPCEHNHYDSVYPSDRRLKHNIETIERGLNYVLSMNPVKYVWSAEAISKFNLKESKAYGLIAQELELLLPECTTKIDGDTLGVDYIKIIPFLIAAIKDLDAKLAVTNQKINTMTKAQNRAYSASYTNEKEIELLKEQVAQQSEQINQLMNKLN